VANVEQRPNWGGYGELLKSEKSNYHRSRSKGHGKFSLKIAQKIIVIICYNNYYYCCCYYYSKAGTKRHYLDYWRYINFSLTLTLTLTSKTLHGHFTGIKTKRAVNCNIRLSSVCETQRQLPISRKDEKILFLWDELARCDIRRAVSGEFTRLPSVMTCPGPIRDWVETDRRCDWIFCLRKTLHTASISPSRKNPPTKMPPITPELKWSPAAPKNTSAFC